MKALIVDDDVDIAEAVALCFEIRWPDTEAVTVLDGRSALRAFRERGADIVVLDRQLPDMDGIEVCKQLRQESNVPIIMLTVSDRPRDIVRGLESGADDYIAKPFDQVELLARAGSLLRRSQRSASSGGTLFADGRLSIKFQEREVAVDGKVVRLTATEYNLLEHIAKSHGKLVTNVELLTRLWGQEYTAAVDYLKVHVTHLRRKLDDDRDDERMITAHGGVGYRIAV